MTAYGELDPFGQWMVRQQLAYAREEGRDIVLERLRAQGYDRVAFVVAALTINEREYAAPAT